MTGAKIGDITNYFQNISVAVVKLEKPLAVGDKVHIKGPNTDFEQEVKSMQIDQEDIDSADPGQLIALKVDDRVRESDELFSAE